MNAELLLIGCFSMLVTSVLILGSVIVTFTKVDRRHFHLFSELDERLR
jgi:hypothetical protein